MQFDFLQVFCDVARHRSFSEAARVKGVTQSAVSQVISQLERRMEVQLIDRSTRPLKLTAAGQTYYEGCKTLIEQYTELEERIRAERAAQTQVVAGTVQVAAIYSVGLSDMGQYVQRFAELYPRAQVHIEYLHPDRVYEKVLDGTSDLGLVSFPRPSPKLLAQPWREEEMILACSLRSPFAQKLAVKPQDLDGQKYIHFDKDLTIRRMVDRFLREQGVAVEVALEFDNIENIKPAVALGAGVALLPEPTVRREVKARTLAAIPLFGCRLVRPLGVIQRRRQRLGSAVRLFLDLLLKEAPAASERTPEVAAMAGGNAYAAPRRLS